MTAKHTPGPWEAVTDFDGRHGHFPIMARWNYLEDQEPHHPKIASVSSSRAGVPVDIAQANARIISAAPDLLEALEKLLDVSKRNIGVDVRSQLYEQVYDAHVQANQAIKKARGE